MLFSRWGRLSAPCALLLSCGGLLVGCGSKDDRPPALQPEADPVPNPDVPEDRLPIATDAFVETACLVKVPGSVTQCGKVTVPEGPGSSRQIELSVVRVFSNEDNVEAEPVIYLEGGPGAGTVDSVDDVHEYFSDIAPDRDFIYFDQRGTGQSVPELSCFEGGAIEDALSDCYDRLSEDSDLDQFNTVNNATDVDLIRQAFGYDKVNLYGISYGTRLGLTVLRDHPKGVRAAILDGVVPLEADLLGQVGRNGYEAFQTLAAACVADEDCNDTYPDPLGQLERLVEQFNDEPVDIKNGELTGDLILLVIFNLLYSPYTLSLIPLMIDNIDNGDYSLFEDLEQAVSSGGISFGMHLSLHCAEELPFTSAEEFRRFDAEVPKVFRAGLTGNFYLDWCEYWPVAKAPASENMAVVSDIPSLVMAGQFDPITPPRYSEQVHDSLSHSQYFLLEGQSHGASTSDCGSRILEKFLRDPESDVVADCLSNLPDLEFAARSLQKSRSNVVGGKIHIRTTPPSGEELEEALEDLKRRLHK